jgi:hypothetical protein
MRSVGGSRYRQTLAIDPGDPVDFHMRNLLDFQMVASQPIHYHCRHFASMWLRSFNLDY